MIFWKKKKKILPKKSIKYLIKFIDFFHAKIIFFKGNFLKQNWTKCMNLNHFDISIKQK